MTFMGGRLVPCGTKRLGAVFFLPPEEQINGELQ
jgi:hypothetical protein